MFKFETQLKKLKHEVLTEVARLAKNDGAKSLANHPGRVPRVGRS